MSQSSHLPHVAQRHPWHQAVYALMALVSQEKARKQAALPQKKPAKQEAGLPAPDVMFWITFRTIFCLFGYLFFVPHVLRPLLFFVPFLIVGRWLVNIVPAANGVVCGFGETLDTLAALINREYANHINELAHLQDVPVESQQSGFAAGDDDEHTVEEEKSDLANPVVIAIETQWLQLMKHMDANKARQHITLPVDLLNQHEPLFVVNRERLLKHGYDCAPGHCYNQDCLVLMTSERKKQLQTGKHSHCNEANCNCDGSWDCRLF